MPADLHVHTTFSDGSDSPEEIVREAKKANLKTIAITDHDVVEGIDPAIKEGKKLGVDVIPGIEFTTETPDKEIHILGYLIDYKNARLKEILAKIQEGRRNRIYKIAEKLTKIGVKLDPARVLELAKDGSAGRPHVARVLLETGIVKSVKEAFDRYLDSRGPAYVPHYKLFPNEAIKLILDVKGVPVLAHPAISKCDDMIPDLVSFGLMGIEAYYPGYSEQNTKYYTGLARKSNLLVTGGSDYHGKSNTKDIGLGGVPVSDELVDILIEAGKRP